MKPYFTLAAAVLTFAGPLSAATFTGPVYPLPNNAGPANFVGYGSNVAGNGKTNTYAGFDLSGFSEVDYS
jgi:hypothetical protein